MMGTVGRDGHLGHDFGPLARLFDAHYTSMLRMATLLLDDRGAAEEVVQDAYVQLHGRRLDFDDPTRAASYLRSTVLNLARSRLRRRGLTRRTVGTARTAPASPEETALVRADQREVLAALDTLPRRQRECLVLRYYLELSEAEIAAALHISAGSVKTHSSRGIAALGRHLEGR